MKCDEWVAYSTGDMETRSFKSAPAQNEASDSLARIRARVPLFPPSRCSPSTTLLSSDSSCFEIAFRACGRFNDTTVMLPECGAGIFEILTEDCKLL